MQPPVTRKIEDLRPYVGGKPIEELARERGLTDIVKLASNECALGPSPLALKAAERALTSVHRYPDGAGFRLRSAIAEFHGVTLDEVVHGNGSNEILELVVRTFMTPEHHIVFGTPAFSMYPVIASSHNAEFTAVPTDPGLTHDLSAIAAAVRDNTRVIFLDNPNNPTGTYVGRAAVERFLREVPEEVIVVMDEAYFEFADAPDYPDSMKLRSLRERLIVLRTFSKAYGMAGFRVGYGVGPKSLIGYLHRLRAPFNVGVVSQEAAIAALTDEDHLKKVVELNASERTRLKDALRREGRTVYPSQTNFILVDFGVPQAELYDKLLGEGVIVRPIPGLSTHLRISIGTRSENDRLLSALQKVAP
jgi:histidinol-phosphate aminotransferase